MRLRHFKDAGQQRSETCSTPVVANAWPVRYFSAQRWNGKG
jgi:hypothetical protein